MIRHARFYCRECRREWIDHSATIQGGQPFPFNGTNCFVCGSPEIEQVEYAAQFPGSDIPRDGDVTRFPKLEYIEKIPGLNSAGNNIIRMNVPSALLVEQRAIEKDSIYDLSDMD